MFLLLGSAPYVPEWLEGHKAIVANRQTTVVAINNAWRLVPGRVDCWLFSQDYFMVSPCPPKTFEDWQAVWCPRFGFHSRGLEFPVWYECPWGSGTMIANALCHLINLQVLQLAPTAPIYIVGCDLQYPKDGPTHFYEGGTPDPLRFTDDQLAYMLFQIKRQAAEFGISIYVGQTVLPTKLPFERKDPKEEQE